PAEKTLDRWPRPGPVSIAVCGPVRAGIDYVPAAHRPPRAAYRESARRKPVFLSPQAPSGFPQWQPSSPHSRTRAGMRPILLQLRHQYRNPVFFGTSVLISGGVRTLYRPRGWGSYLAIVYRPFALVASDLVGTSRSALSENHVSMVTVTSNCY